MGLINPLYWWRNPSLRGKVTCLTLANHYSPGSWFQILLIICYTVEARPSSISGPQAPQLGLRTSPASLHQSAESGWDRASLKLATQTSVFAQTHGSPTDPLLTTLLSPLFLFFRKNSSWSRGYEGIEFRVSPGPNRGESCSSRNSIRFKFVNMNGWVLLLVFNSHVA